MGALQVPRVAVALASALAALAGGLDAARADDAGREAGAVTATVAIVDARLPAPTRDGSRARFAAALAEVNGLTLVDGERALALAGEVADADAHLAATALAEARDGFGALDCGRARPAAEDAVRLLAARHAGGLDEAVRLRAAWTYVFLCADRDGDRSMAVAAADRLRALGGNPAVPADAWARYPEIDAATDRDIVELTVSGPVGAAVTIDHVAVGIAPLTRFVVAGKRVVAVASGTRRGAVLATVHGRPLALEVAAVERAAAWRDVAGRVAAWQGAAPPSASEVTELMARVDVRFAIVLGERDAAALWARRPGERTATLVVDGALAEPLALAAGVMARVEAWTGGGPDPDRPLSGADDRLVREAARPREPARWWVYAVIGGALAAGAVTLYALEAGQDRQIIDLTFP